MVPFTTDTLKAMMDKHGEHVADIMNAQCSIKFLGPEFVRRVASGLPRLGKGTVFDVTPLRTVLDDGTRACGPHTRTDTR